MKIENIETFNWVGAMHGMRNPLESWKKSDTELMSLTNKPILGPNDLDLAKRLCAAGPEHRKWMRQVFVSMDITAPLFWWKEMDQYRIGCTTNSTSTMHKLASTPITIDCFETDDMVEDLTFNNITPINVVWEDLLNACEALRKCYNDTKDPRYWKELIRLLPESWLQTRTWTGNYEVLHTIYHQRKNHKLTEWKTFCNIIENELPYAKEFII
jgi:hypothetical protein